jgi:hypothetical protein
MAKKRKPKRVRGQTPKGQHTSDEQNAFSTLFGWIITASAVLAIIASAIYVRGQVPSPKEATSLEISSEENNSQSSAVESTSIFLPRTRSLVQQKVNSLFAYNDERSVSELQNFFKSQTGSDLSHAGFAELNRLMVEEIIPDIWDRAQNDWYNQPVVLHSTMHKWIQLRYPHQTLTNADVIVFPDDEDLRMVVSEPISDYFRDSGWHWKWIGDFLANRTESDAGLTYVGKEKELDVYAAEELSEFLSVMGVALVEIAAARDTDGTLEANDLSAVYEEILGIERKVDKKSDHKSIPFHYSETDKRAVLDAIETPMFLEITVDTGVDYFHRPGKSNWNLRTRLRVPVGLDGGGVAANDYDQDGDIDLYFAGDSCGRLYRNDGHGKFSDVHKEAGLPVKGETRAGYFADYDNDGDNDLLLTFCGAPHVLLNNDGKGKFTDVTEVVKLNSGNRVTHEAVWFDMNNDGLLDLYVANYGDWRVGAIPTLGRKNENATPNELFVQSVDKAGNHQFTEVGKDMGVGDRGWTHCVSAFDIDRDGWQDLFSLNDFGASLVYKNKQGKGFEEVSGKLKLDDIYNAMNFTLIDINHDGNLSIYVSEIMKLIHRQRYMRPTEQTEVVFNADVKDNMRIIVDNSLLTMEPGGFFSDRHNLLIEPSEMGWAWGVLAYDYENDSDEDLIVLNGTETELPPANQNAMKGDTGFLDGRYFLSIFRDEANVCFLQKDGYFYNVSSSNPIGFKGNSRSAVAVDLDDDGDQDAVVINYDAPAMIFENLQSSDNHWIDVQLEGTRSNRNAVGATVEVRFGNQRRFKQVVSRTGFLSQGTYRLHFGIGKADKVDQVIIKWPSQGTQIVENLAIDQLHHIKEPAAGNQPDAGP